MIQLVSESPFYTSLVAFYRREGRGGNPGEGKAQQRAGMTRGS